MDLSWQAAKITLQMEKMIQNAPGHKFHNLTDAQLQLYNNLSKRKSILMTQIEMIMVHDGEL